MSTQRAREDDVTAQTEAPSPEADEAEDRLADDLMRTVADGLTQQGLAVRDIHGDEAHVLKVTNAGRILCEVDIYDGGSAVWEYGLRSETEADPARITGIAMNILAANVMESEATLAREFPNLTLKGRAGRALAERGMLVSLETYEDEFFFDVYSEIEVTNPAQPARGTVRIADDNSIRWECRLTSPVAGTGGIDPRDFAETIVKAVTS